MNTRGIRFSNVAFGMVLLAGLGVGAVHLTLGLYHLTIIAWLTAGVGALTLAAELVPWAARFLREELSMVRRMPAPGRPLRVRVIAARGRCVWGYHEVDRWAINARGRVTPSICRSAASALSLATRRAGDGDQEECQVVCRCPLPERKVTFTVQPAAAAA